MEKVKLAQENIDNLIDKWHESVSEQELHEYLGLTLEQYTYWVETNELPNY